MPDLSTAHRRYRKRPAPKPSETRLLCPRIARCRSLAAEDPLGSLSRLNAEVDIRRQRRDASLDEIMRLLETARHSGKDFRGLTGEDRYVLYAVAFQTGLRAGELGSLMPASFELEADPPVLHLKASRSKRRRNDVQPLTVELADLLRPWLAGRPADQLVWPGTWATAKRA